MKPCIKEVCCHWNKKYSDNCGMSRRIMEMCNAYTIDLFSLRFNPPLLNAQRYDASMDGEMMPDDDGGYVTVEDYEYLLKLFREK